MAKAKFTDEQCVEFERRLREEDGMTVKQLCDEYGVSYSTMCKYVNIGKQMHRDEIAAKRKLVTNIAETLAARYEEPFVSRFLGYGYYGFCHDLESLLNTCFSLEELKSKNFIVLFENKVLGLDARTDIHYTRWCYGVAMFVMWFQLTHRKETVI